MLYSKKITILSALVLALALVFILTLIFDPSTAQRGSAFAWLDPSLLVLVDRLELYGPEGFAILRRRNGVWVFDAGAIDLPVKQARAEDLLSALSRKQAYLLHRISSEGRERLGLTVETASRIIVRGGAGLPLLDLLIGAADALGTGVYVKRADRNEIYTAEDLFTLYTDSSAGSWFDLRLFNRGIDAALVQQADVSLPGAKETYTLQRSGRGWVLYGNENAELDVYRVDSWLRSVLEAEAEDFSTEPMALAEGSIVLYPGDGTARALRVGPADEEQRRSAAVSGTELVYLLPERTLSRLFRESGYFYR
jgi:hypothetical protein